VTSSSTTSSNHPTQTSQASILLVEDKDSLRTMLKLAIEGQGHAVVEARDQPEALQALQQGRPALVLTDLRLPDGDGFGVLRFLRDTAANSTISAR
jgi:CheY-like chemotaxis protein